MKPNFGRFLPQTFRARLVTMFTLLTLSIIFLTSLTIYLTLSQWLQKDSESRLYDEWGEMQSAYTFTESRLSLTHRGRWNETEHKVQSTSAFFIQIIDTRGQVLWRTPNLADSTLPTKVEKNAPARPSLRFFEAKHLGHPVRVLKAPLYEGDALRGWMEIACYTSVWDFLLPLRTLLMAILLLAFLLAVAGGIALSNRALKPLKNIISELALITHHDFRRRISFRPDVHDEVSSLSASLNQLLTRLEGAFQRTAQFTANASHELQTPLAVIKGEAEVTLLQPRSVDYYQQTLRKILTETEQMIEMVRTLLLLARSDSQSLGRENEVLDLQLLFHDEFLKLRQFADQKNQQVAFLPPVSEMFLVQGDELLLRQVYRNLFLNAVQYTPPSGQIIIDLAQDEQQVRFRISDNGVGIWPTEIGRIFDRFYRVQQQEVRQLPGSGLGLPLAKMIVEMHAGKISVESQIGAGTTVLVELPRFHAKINP